MSAAREHLPKWADEAARCGVPGHCIDGLVLYIEHGIEPGSFLTAVLSNDLKGAFATADDTNRDALHAYVRFLYAVMPSESQGSPTRFAEWIERGGLFGREAA